jgi:hypothetical protein
VPDSPKKILGRKFIQALLDAGVVTPGEAVRRVVIDADVNEIVVMYVERFGDERLLQLVPAMTGVQINQDEPVEPRLVRRYESVGPAARLSTPAPNSAELAGDDRA